MQVISSVNYSVEALIRTIPIQCNDTSKTTGIKFPILLGLSNLFSIKTPYTSMVLKQLAWVFPWNQWGSFRSLAGIVRRTKWNKNMSLFIKSNRLTNVFM